MDTTKTSLRGFHIFSLLALACALATLVLSCISLGTMGEVYGMAPGIGDIVIYFYQIHGFFAFFLALFTVALLFVHAARETLAKISVWALLILAVMHITPFFTDTIFYMTTMSFGAGLNYFSAYVPALMTAVVAIGLLSKWNSSDPYAVNRLALICSLISIFMCIVYLVQASSLLSLTSTLHDNAQIWGLIFGNLGVTFSCILFWALTSSRRRYERIMYDMNDTEAAIFEAVDDRMDAESQRIEAEVQAEMTLAPPPRFEDIPAYEPQPKPQTPQMQSKPQPKPAQPKPQMRPQSEPVEASPAPAQAPPPIEEETRRSRFIPASENLHGELPLQSRQKSRKTEEEEW